MKRLLTIVLALIVLAAFSGCSHYYYKKPKPFHPPKQSKVRECRTYADVTMTAGDHYRASKKR